MVWQRVVTEWFKRCTELWSILSPPFGGEMNHPFSWHQDGRVHTTIDHFLSLPCIQVSKHPSNCDISRKSRPPLAAIGYHWIFTQTDRSRIEVPFREESRSKNQLSCQITSDSVTGPLEGSTTSDSVTGPLEGSDLRSRCHCQLLGMHLISMWTLWRQIHW